MAICPECDAELDMDEGEMDEGGVISCADCGCDLEIVNSSPLELRLIGEDDDEDDEEDELDEDFDDEEEEEDEEDDDDEDFDEEFDEDEDEE
jgi:lysine biosynthesis protein LysW